MAAPKAAVLGGAKSAKADLDAAVFGETFHMSLVHETVRAELKPSIQVSRIDDRTAVSDSRASGLGPSWVSDSAALLKRPMCRKSAWIFSRSSALFR